jgi:hypothetical protein
MSAIWALWGGEQTLNYFREERLSEARRLTCRFGATARFLVIGLTRRRFDFPNLFRLPAIILLVKQSFCEQF